MQTKYLGLKGTISLFKCVGLSPLTPWLSSFFKCEIELHIGKENTLYNDKHMCGHECIQVVCVYHVKSTKTTLLLHQQVVVAKWSVLCHMVQETKDSRRTLCMTCSWVSNKSSSTVVT